jgi:SPP1 gp7 family putative phage head morphogenesis protein
MGLHLSLLAAAARGHRKRHGNARSVRRLSPVVPNARAELAYKSALLSLVRHCRKLTDAALAELKIHWRSPTSDGFIADGAPPNLLDHIRAAARKLGGLDKWSKKMVGLAVEANRDSVDERLARAIHKAIGVDVSKLLSANGPLLQSMKVATDTNVALIKTIPEQYFYGLRNEQGGMVRRGVVDVITDAWTQGSRWESMVEDIQAVGDVNENRAKLIARDQTAKMNEAFNRERCGQVGIERGEWLTSQDERVRANHAEMEGVVYDLNGVGPLVSDDGQNCFPGDDYQCRCTFAPVVDMEELAIGTGYGERQTQQEEEMAA